MGKYWKYLTAGAAIGGFLVIFTFTKVSLEAVKIVFTAGKTFKGVILKEKPHPVSGYDVITSASICADNSSFSGEEF